MKSRLGGVEDDAVLADEASLGGVHDGLKGCSKARCDGASANPDVHIDASDRATAAGVRECGGFGDECVVRCPLAQ